MIIKELTGIIQINKKKMIEGIGIIYEFRLRG